MSRLWVVPLIHCSALFVDTFPLGSPIVVFQAETFIIMLPVCFSLVKTERAYIVSVIHAGKIYRRPTVPHLTPLLAHGQ